MFNTIFYFFRWAKLRAAMVPFTIFLEPLSECILLGLLTAWSVFYLFRWDPVSFFLLHILIWFLMDWMLIHVVQNGSLPFNISEFVVRLNFIFYFHKNIEKNFAICNLLQWKINLVNYFWIFLCTVS